MGSFSPLLLQFLQSARGIPVPAAYVQEPAEAAAETQTAARAVEPGISPVRRTVEPPRELFQEAFELMPSPGIARTSQAPRAMPAQEEEADVIALDEAEELEVRVGETVTYAPLGRQGEPMTVQIVAGPSDVANARINEGMPVAQALFSAIVDDEVVLGVPGREPQKLVVRKIVRTSSQ